MAGGWRSNAAMDGAQLSARPPSSLGARSVALSMAAEQQQQQQQQQAVCGGAYLTPAVM